MKSYLDLVKISAKVHKKQSQMSIFCIILAVFLVTTIFGMADMFIRSQIIQAQIEYGNWHIMARQIDAEIANRISSRQDVKSIARYGVLNYRGQLDYTIDNKKTIIVGCDESLLHDIILDSIESGSFPKSNKEIMVSENTKNILGLKIGNEISINTPENNKLTYIISGFVTNTAKLMSDDMYGVFLTTEEFQSIYPANEGSQALQNNSVLYIQFKDMTNYQNAIGNIKMQYNLADNQISENTKLLGLIGQSSSSFMIQVYGVAGVLFVLVLAAGVLMIASSLNSNIAQRTEFFGMIRCIGATPKQIMRLVRKEALSWCKYAIVIGVAVGVIVIWILCFILRYLSPEYFGAMPAFSVSVPSIIAGTIVGLITVILAARSPAKRASKVSPLMAVSGNANNLQPIRKAANTNLFKVDTALGVHHAKSSKRNFLLMVGSFSLSIILFMSFSVTIDFMNHALTPVNPWSADISIISPDNTNTIEKSMVDKLSENPAVKKIYGRMFEYDVSANVNGEDKKFDVISYEKNQFNWAKNYLIKGDVKTAQTQIGTGFVVYEKSNTVQVNDIVKLNINGQIHDIKIVGMLSECPFNNANDVGTIICSEKTFQTMAGQSNLTIVDIQLSRGVKDEEVDKIHSFVGTEYTFSDNRLNNRGVLGTYYCFAIFIYGFLALIALITIFNIINSISMSVSARLKQYGAFRAIGLSNHQLIKMIYAEALTYALTGCVCGSIIGVAFNYFLFTKLISFNWGDLWSIPFVELCIILIIVGISIIIAVKNPIKKIKNMSIVETINYQ